MARHGKVWSGTAAAVAVAALSAALLARQPSLQVDDAVLAAAGSRTSDWLTYGRTYDEQRFSPLDQINERTVLQLGLAWSFDTGTDRGLEATPLVVDGVMYTTGSWSIVYALEARTGRLLWKWDPKVDPKYDRWACCDVVNRGAAFYKGRVYVGVLDGRLAALDAKSGAVVWETVTVDQTVPYTITGAPRIAKGRVLIGNGGAEYGVRGYISAYDAATGTLAWRFYTVPGDPSKPQESKALDAAVKTWTGTEFWKQGGGGTVWDSFVYDPELDTVYVGTGNGAVWNRHLRSPDGGDNLYLASILALDAATGDLKWHYQTTPGDTWDYTAVQPLMLADLTIGGTTRKVLMQAPKNGFFYVLDRTNGRLISADAYVAVTWATHVDMTTGRPVEIKGAEYTTEGAFVRPGPLGGHNWQAMSYSPRTGLVYLPAQDNGRYYERPTSFTFVPGQYNLGLANAGRNPERFESPYAGRLIAWDPVAKQPRWSVEYGSYWNGGTLATAGNLVLQGTATGDIVAYRATDGTKLWSTWAGTGVVAPPITYAVDGQQYVSVMAGWGGAFANRYRSSGKVLTFTLGGKAALATRPLPRQATPIPHTSTPEQRAAGAKLYATYCARCHGGGTVLPDLRTSPAGVYDAYEKILLSGSLSQRGMPAFTQLEAAEVAAIKAYVLQERQALTQK